MTTAAQTTSWEDTLRLPATPDTLEMLFSGMIAGLCVPDFLTQEECAALKKRSEECEFKDYIDVVPRIARFGITVFEFDRIGKRQYFDAVESANRSVGRITKDVCSPLQRVIDWLLILSPNRNVNIACEPGFGSYFAGLFRRIEEGTLIHVDFAPMEQPGWSVAKVCSQLACNIYLDIPPDDPGAVRIWQREAHKEYEKFKIPGSYGYQPDVIEGVPFATITPQTGMLMVINTRNFHQVSNCSGSRLAVSAAIGQMPDKNLVLWS